MASEHVLKRQSAKKSQLFPKKVAMEHTTSSRLCG